MDIHTKIAIKKAIESNRELVKKVLNGENYAIERFAELSGTSPVFVRQNISLIKNWT